MSAHKRDQYSLYLALFLALIYAAIVCRSGVPALRHDWFWPRERYAFIDLITTSASGWSTTGIGSPSPYPGAYLIGTALGLVGVAFGAIATLALFVFAIGMGVTVGARLLAIALGGSAIQIATLEIFALFNPWVYDKTVAGHLYMLLAYGACFAILAELFRPAPRQRRIGLLLLLVLPQLQFYLIAMCAVTLHAVLKRVYIPWLTGVIIGMPMWVGLALDHSSLLHTPYTLAWETSQSVDPSSAPVLTGYFANYTSHFSGLQVGALWLFVACACFATIYARNYVITRTTLIAVALVLVLAMGTRGVLGSSYAGIVLHFRESGVFRELYDLLAFAAIGYCILIASLPTSRIFLAVNISTLIAALVIASAWITWPPSSYWVGAQNIPLVRIDTAPDTRFALFPAFQPMQFGGKGSGADPDAYARPGSVTPFNEYLAQYPVDSSLSSFLLRHDAGPLAALSTSLVIERAGLNTDEDALRLQLNGIPPTSSFKISRHRYVKPLPEVTLSQYPMVGSLVNRLGAGNIFFADARNIDSASLPLTWRRLPTFVPVAASNAFVDEQRGWVDVHFDFAALPELAQGLGGAVTTNSGDILPVRPGWSTLINVSGTLLSQDNQIVHQSTAGYEWIRLSDNVHGLRCAGRCVVVGQSNIIRRIPLNPAPRAYQTAKFTILTPWLVRVLVPESAFPILRYNVAYDPNWVAYVPGGSITHLRLDATVNGWILGAAAHPYVVYLVHRVALAQTLVEILGFSWIVGLVLARLPPARGRQEQAGGVGQNWLI